MCTRHTFFLGGLQVQPAPFFLAGCKYSPHPRRNTGASNDGNEWRIRMYRVRQENLPFVGSSHEFVGADHGDVNISVFLLSALPGKGPGPHRHPYDEIQFVREGRGLWTVNGQTFEGSAGDIFVIKAGEIHSFKAIGDGPLVQVDVHLSPRFIQENLA